MLLHFADAMQAGEDSAMLDLTDDIVQNLLLSMWDADAPEGGTEAPKGKVDRKTKNRLSAQQARATDKQYVNLMLAELENLSDTFEMYAEYIAQLKVHAADAVEGMASLEATHAQNKIRIKTLQHRDTVNSPPALFGMSTKERNRIHAQKSRQRRHSFVQDLMQQRDDSWSTMQDVVKHTTDLESACSVLHDFDDTGHVLLQLTETKQRLLMHTDAHQRKYEELKSRLSFRVMQREKF
jgi:hypothetical protein